MNDTPKLTDYQYEVLGILARAHAESRLVFVGGKTVGDDGLYLLAHWKPVRRLIELGLARSAGAWSDRIEITKRGLAVWRELTKGRP